MYQHFVVAIVRTVNIWVAKERLRLTLQLIKVIPVVGSRCSHVSTASRKYKTDFPTAIPDCLTTTHRLLHRQRAQVAESLASTLQVDHFRQHPGTQFQPWFHQEERCYSYITQVYWSAKLPSVDTRQIHTWKQPCSNTKSLMKMHLFQVQEY